MRELTVFPDTNVFLQCHPLHELPWLELFDFDVLQILIAPIVVDEIDRLKHDGNARRARRARAANSYFGQMLDDPSESKSFEMQGRKIVVRFGPHLPAERVTPQTLDRTHSDDNLIEAVWFYSRDNSPATLISGDNGLDLRARRHSVVFRRVPDTWLLPPEPDERDKQLRALQTRVDDLEDAQPKVSVEIRAGVQALERLQLTIPLYAPLTTVELEALYAQLRERCPRATRFANPPAAPGYRSEFDKRLIESIPMEMIGVSKDEIEEYETEYAKWESAARQRLARFPIHLNAKYRWSPLTIEIDNVGTTSAEHLLLEIGLYDGLRACVATPDDEIPKPYAFTQKLRDSPQIPRPPQAPRPMSSFDKAFQGMRAGTLSDHYLFPRNYPVSSPFAGDRHALRIREDDEKLLPEWSIECDEFRHGRGPRQIRCWVALPADVEPSRSRLFLRVTAKNMATPLERHIPIELIFEPRSTYVHAQRWVLADSKDRDELEEALDDEDDSHAEA